MPLNFWIIIFAQFVTFLLFYFYSNRSKKTLSSKNIFSSAIFGIIIGMLYDLVFVKAGVFEYLENGSTLNLSITQLLLNGSLSYGLAVLTAKYMIVGQLDRAKRANNILFALLFILCISLALVIHIDPGLASIFLCGLVMILCGEILLMLKNKLGPVMSVLYLKNIQANLVLWVKIVAIALACEVANLYFPFWRWLPGSDYSPVFINSIIIIFGYVALLHPMVVFWRIIENKNQK